MNRSFFKFLIPLIVLIANSKSSFANECCNDAPWVARAEAGGAVGQFIGQKHKYLEAGLFLGPAPTENWFFFTDLRAYRLDNRHFAASAGVGGRFRANSRLWGGNVYYDYIDAKVNSFNQVGVGLESLGSCFDLRVNGYLPTKDLGRSSFKTHNYPGGYSIRTQELEFSFRGVDAEIGTTLWKNCNMSFYGAVGPYYYNNKHLNRNIYGGQGRLEFWFSEYLRLEARYSISSHYHSQFQGKFMISVPLEELLSCFCIDKCREFFTQPVKRNGLEFFQHCCNSEWNW